MECPLLSCPPYEGGSLWLPCPLLPHIPFHSTGPGIYKRFHSFIQQLFAESCPVPGTGLVKENILVDQTDANPWPQGAYTGVGRQTINNHLSVNQNM